MPPASSPAPSGAVVLLGLDRLPDPPSTAVPAGWLHQPFPPGAGEPESSEFWDSLARAIDAGSVGCILAVPARATWDPDHRRPEAVLRPAAERGSPAATAVRLHSARLSAVVDILRAASVAAVPWALVGPVSRHGVDALSAAPCTELARTPGVVSQAFFDCVSPGAGVQVIRTSAVACPTVPSREEASALLDSHAPGGPAFVSLARDLQLPARDVRSRRGVPGVLPAPPPQGHLDAGGLPISRPLAPLGPLSGVLAAKPAATGSPGGPFLGGMRRPSATIHMFASRDQAASALTPVLLAAVRQAPELVRFITGLLQGGPAPPASAPAPVSAARGLRRWPGGRCMALVAGCRARAAAEDGVGGAAHGLRHPDCTPF